MKKILLILFLFGCENTITEISDDAEISYGVVINEINYNSSSDLDTGDWVELYNSTDESVEISLWEFRDDANLFIVPENTILSPGHYLVLCEDSSLFSQVFPDVSNLSGNLEFGLDGAGELIRLFDSDGLLVDEVEYDDVAPWPIGPDGYGPTLELVDPSLDNALGESWAASSENGGTPGGMNSTINE